MSPALSPGTHQVIDVASAGEATNANPVDAEFPLHGKILIADDIGVNRQLFELNVRRFFGKGWSVVSAETAEEAVDT
eukprot:1792028-Prymnesium_polylepis.1